MIGGGAWCANVVEQCARIGFDGAVWPVHPRAAQVGGIPAVPSLDALPEAPDAVFIGVNRDATTGLVADLARMGAGGAVCFASGFAERPDGATLQADLVAAAGQMPILGPNCYGLLNLLDGVALWPDHHGAERVDRGVAILTQSSNIAINLTMQRRGLPLAYMATLGNQAQTDLAALGQAMLADDRVTALGVHLEGLAGPSGLERLAATARAAGKPIVALKVGRSEAGAGAALSHTAALSGSAAGASALLRRLGIAEVTSLSALLETLKILHHHGPLRSANVASMSCSGGEAGLMADAGAVCGISYPALTGQQRADLRAVLGPDVALANPLDYHTTIWGNREAMAQTFAAMVAGPAALGVIVLDFPRTDRCAAPLWDVVVEAAGDAQAQTGKPIAILSSLPDTMDEAQARAIAARGLIPLAGLQDGLAALRAAAEVWARPAPHAPVLTAPPPRAPRLLGEAEAKARLSAFGLPVPRAIRAGDPAAAGDAAARLGGSVVVKGEGVAHKTEAGAVRLGLSGRDAVAQAAERMEAEGYLVEEMVTDMLAELLVGITLDPAHGYVLTLAAGGTLAEVLDDRASLMVPSTPEDISVALDSLRMAPVLDGWRGAPPVARAPLVEAILSIQSFVMAHAGQVAEVEVNPLICRAHDVVAADALISMEVPDDPT